MRGSTLTGAPATPKPTAIITRLTRAPSAVTSASSYVTHAPSAVTHAPSAVTRVSSGVSRTHLGGTLNFLRRSLLAVGLSLATFGSSVATLGVPFMATTASFSVATSALTPAAQAEIPAEAQTPPPQQTLPAPLIPPPPQAPTPLQSPAPTQAQALFLRQLTPSPELKALSDRIEVVRNGLLQQFGIKDVFIGGGSSRAILDHLYDGKPIEMRDLDFFVVAGREVTEELGRSIGQKLESPAVGKYSNKDLRPRPRGNPNLPAPQKYTYNAGYGFFWSGGGIPDIFDISIYHQLADLHLNGIFDIDTVMIPLHQSLLETIRQQFVGRNYSRVAQEGTVLDRYQGYQSWRRRSPRVVHWDEFDRDPVLQGIRVARTMAKVGRARLSPADEAHIIASIEKATNTNHLQIVRNLLKLLEDRTAAEQIQILLRFGVFKMLDQDLHELLLKQPLESLQKSLAQAKDALGKLNQLISAMPARARLHFLFDVALVEPDWAYREIAERLSEEVDRARLAPRALNKFVAAKKLEAALSIPIVAQQIQNFWQNPQLEPGLAAWLSLRAALRADPALATNAGTTRENLSRLFPQATLSEQRELALAVSGLRIGYFTGVLNPFHDGHRQLLLTAIRSLGLDQIYVIPTVKTKHNETPIGWADRQEMIRAGTADIPEVKLLGPEYYGLLQQGTAPALKRLFETFGPDAKLVHVMGADSFDRFVEAGYLEQHRRDRHEVAVVSRPGYQMPALTAEQAGQISFLQTANMVVYSEQARSSTVIRQRLAKGEGIAGMVPPAVEQYILSRGLYAETTAPLVPQEINFREYGSRSAPPLVLIHGVDSSLSTFEGIVATLAEQFRVIVYDQRGHGSTMARGEDYSTKTLANDLRVLLDHLDLSSVFLLGHSMGARTAVRFASLYPERVRALILEDMEFLARSKDSDEQIREKARAASDIPLEYTSGEELIKGLSPTFGKLKAQSVLQHQTTRLPEGRLKLAFDPKVSVLYRSQASREDFTTELSRLTMPVLVIRADPKVSVITPTGLEHLRQGLPQARVVTIEGSSHYVHQRSPKPYLNAVIPFLVQAQLPSAPSCRVVVGGRASPGKVSAAFR